MTDIQKFGDDLMHSLSKAASENPLSSVLIGAGIVWMIAGATRPTLAPVSRLAAGVGSSAAGSIGAVKHAMTDEVSAARDTLGDLASTAQETVQDSAKSMKSMLNDAQGELSDRASRTHDSAIRMTGSTKERIDLFFKRQPLTLAAVGVAIGAGIAATIPSSDLEKDVMGEASAHATSAVSSLVRERSENIKEAFLSEAAEQGLAPEKAKE